MLKSHHVAIFAYVLFATVTPAASALAADVDAFPQAFFDTYCTDCHGPDKQKGDIQLDTASHDLTNSDNAFFWEDVLEQIELGEMPTKKAEKHPSPKEVDTLTAWLSASLTEARAAAEVGGTVLRRLNRAEYEQSVRELFGIVFSAPLSFPEDPPHHGFDNIGEGLVMSPPLMEQYFQIATQVADQVIPPAQNAGPVSTNTFEITPADLSISFSSGAVVDGAMRIVSKSDPVARSCTWAIRFEAKHPGHYRLNLTLSKFKPWDDKPMVLEVRALNNNESTFGDIHSHRKLAEFQVDSPSPTLFSADIELYEGETLVFYYQNAPLDSDNNKEDVAALETIVRDLFKKDPHLHAAWLKKGYPRGFRGCGSWHELQQIKKEPTLDLSTADINSKETAALIKLILRNTVASLEAIACGHFETGPGLDIHHAQVVGPLPLQNKIVNITPDQLTSTDLSGVLVDNHYRLVSSQNVVARSGVWPRRYEARVSGRYILTVDASTFQAPQSTYPHRAKPYRLELYAMPASANTYQPIDTLRKLTTFEVSPDSTQTFTAEVELYRGQTVVFRWGDSPMYSVPPEKTFAIDAYNDRLKNKRLYAAWLKLGADRGATEARYYEKLNALTNSDDLDLNDPRLDKLPTAFPGDKHNQLKRYFLEELRRFGPALTLNAASIRGPVALVEDDQMRQQRLITSRFLTQRNNLTDDDYARQVLHPFLTRAFRRPVSDERLNQYVTLALQHAAQGHRFEDGMHLAIRTALTSPSFLYRAHNPGKLDNYDLAARLAYFIWNGPPDEKLIRLAQQGKLTNPQKLAAETRRLLRSSKSKRFVQSFTGQWLGTRKLEQIMPDERLLKFIDSDRQAMVDETELFFAEILNKNLPLETFIDPDFTYLNDRLVKNIYKLKGVKTTSKMTRTTIPRGSRVGGILGQATVMMATANGVDTQPILRGVWLLENILGDPPPEPPQNVPAIEPDTTGATSIREQLQAHRLDESCANCHRKIDPLGLALENFDPVGRWRTHYPIYTVNKSGKSVTTQGDPVDASGQMPNGDQFNDVLDLKQYMLKNIDQFANCLAEKLMTYATGRTLSYGDHHVVQQVVANNKQHGSGFEDLLISLVQSDVFTTK